MIYTFKFDILQGGIGVSEGLVNIDLTETEMLFVYAAHKSDDKIFKAKALKSVNEKARIAIERALKRTPNRGPRLQGVIDIAKDAPKELIVEAMNNPLSDTLVYFINHAEQIDSIVFYDGVREYCDRILKDIKQEN